jgi:hypothetical protein
MKYKIVGIYYDDINKCLEEGWKLYGNPFQHQNGDIMQALTWEDEKCAVCIADKNLKKKI